MFQLENKIHQPDCKNNFAFSYRARIVVIPRGRSPTKKQSYFCNQTIILFLQLYLLFAKPLCQRRLFCFP